MLYPQPNLYFKVNCKINTEVMIKLGVQHNGTFTEWYEMQRNDATRLKTNGSKMRSSFEKLGNTTSAS